MMTLIIVIEGVELTMRNTIGKIVSISKVQCPTFSF